MKVIQILILLIFVALTACQPGPAALTEADKAAIEASGQSFVDAVLAADWEALAAMYTVDAVLMPPNGPAAEGRANIHAWFEAFPPVSEMTFEFVEIEGLGDMVYVRGTFAMTITAPGMNQVNDTGKFIEIRKKQTDDSWLLHRDIFNSDVAMTH